MIDIHCHILYGVDDGSPDYLTSRRMLEVMADSGVTAIIATPHFRRHMFSYPLGQIEEAYAALRRYAASLNIAFYIGCEYHVSQEIFEHLESGRVHTLADTDYVLTEYSHSAELDRILHYTQDLIMRGWKPVIAHAERIEVFQRKPALVEKAVDAGARIQINANSVLGIDGREAKKCARKLLDFMLVDFVASDSHNLLERAPHLQECHDLIRRKYGDGTASLLFRENARRILEESRFF